MCMQSVQRHLKGSYCQGFVIIHRTFDKIFDIPVAPHSQSAKNYINWSKYQDQRIRKESGELLKCFAYRSSNFSQAGSGSECGVVDPLSRRGHLHLHQPVSLLGSSSNFHQALLSASNTPVAMPQPERPPPW